MSASIPMTGSSRKTGDRVLNEVLSSVQARAWAGFQREAGDYEKGGLIYCGKCGTPKTTVLHLPTGEQIVPCMCDCENETWEKERQAERTRDAEMEVRRMRSVGIRSGLQDATFDNAEEGTNPKILRMAKRYVESWQEMRRDNVGFLFCGKPGNGKTYTAACIANALVDQGIPVMMTSFPKVLAELAGMGQGDDRNGFLRSFDRYELLVLDDLGAERRTDYALEIVFALIDQRYVSGKPMIVTTNLTREELENADSIALRRIYDRVLEMCIPVTFQRESIRQEKKDSKTDRAREILFGSEEGM